MKAINSGKCIFLCLAVLQFLLIGNLFSQDIIYLRNPSFEDQPRMGGSIRLPIQEWADCGLTNFPDQSPPDIHPVKGAAFGVKYKANDGKTYLGLVTRYSDTYESLSQYLTSPLIAGKCYRVSVHLALSENYNSPTPRSRLVHTSTGGRYYEIENFSHPVELFIWGGDSYCRNHKLLARSGPVSNTDWNKFTLELSPKQNYHYITIGAFFEKGYSEPYNGHVLVDNFSPIIEVNCE